MENNSSTSSSTTPPVQEDCDKKDFIKLVYDFTKDILTTFPEEADKLNNALRDIVISEDLDTIESDVVDYVWEHCKKVYPPRFFDILYQNTEIFNEDNTEDVRFLPGIDFRKLWNYNDLTDNTRETIWKYLQLLMLCVVGKVWDDKSFGDTANLFEAIDENTLKTKLEDTIKDMENMFKNVNEGDMEDVGEGMRDLSANLGSDTLPNPEDLHNHISGLLKGKIGRLAQEIAEEAAEDLSSEFGDIKSSDQIFKQLFKNPGKLINLVKKVGGKLEEKIKSGEIKESELLKEATDFMTNMKDMPGMNNIQGMLGKMGVPGLNKDVKLNLGAMNGMMRNAQARDRMRDKLAKLREQQSQNQSQNQTEFKKFSTGEKVEKSQKNKNDNDNESSKKKKKNKKKNKK